jgi:DNA-binding protein H-NS
MRVDIDKQLQSRKAELQAQLAQIGSDSNGGSVRSVKGSRVPPKYKHPKTGETWSGRGGVAGWLAREIKGGKKREDFLIAKPVRKKRAK